MRRRTAFALLGLTMVVTSAVSLMSGDVPLSLQEIAQAIFGSASPAATLIVVELRLPRLLMALLVGMALGVAGAIMQVVLHNPLAEPGLLGLNSGAALAASVVLMLVGTAAPSLLSTSAFAGALFAASAVYFVSLAAGRSPVRLLLIGLGFGTLTGGLATAVSLTGDTATAQRLMTWLAGSVYDSSVADVVSASLGLAIPLAAAALMARELDYVELGDETALGLGQRVSLVRLVALGLCSILVGIAVANAGPIAFVGLVAPLLARLLMGSDNTARLVFAGGAGALLVALSDIVGRSIVPGLQLPVGLITPIVGSPVLAVLALRSMRFR